MKQGPLSEKELEWLETILAQYGKETAVKDVSELDGMLTALIAGPQNIEPATWLVALWGGEAQLPAWQSQREMDRFMNLTFQHLNDIADQLNGDQDEYGPIFNASEDEETLTAESWCTGYLRGSALSDWSGLPSELSKAMTIFSDVAEGKGLSGKTIGAIPDAAIELHNYWMTQRQTRATAPVNVAEKPGRNDPCPCGSGKKYKQCCLR